MSKQVGLSNIEGEFKSGRTAAIKVDKGWGYELHIVNDPAYCMKKLVFTKKDAQFSMHFHKDKKETWYVEKGKFRVDFIFTETAERGWAELSEGDAWTNETLFPHRLTCLSENAEITEVSTYDTKEDNYRVEPGDSQKEEAGKKDIVDTIPKNFVSQNRENKH